MNIENYLSSIMVRSKGPIYRYIPAIILKSDSFSGILILFTGY